MVSAAITTICDMVEHVRLRLDDVSPVAAIPTTNLELIQQAAEDADESDLLWTTAELVHFANEAIKEVALRTQCIRDSGRDTVGLTSYAITAGTNSITVDRRVLSISRVWWDDTVLPAKVLIANSEQFMDEGSSTWRTNTTDAPREFVCERTSRRLQLVGLPTVDGTIMLDVIRLPLEVIEDGVPEIPQQYLADCLDHMCALAYMKNDADTKDPDLSLRFAKLFERNVGPRPTNLVLELEYHQSGRRRPRGVWF